MASVRLQPRQPVEPMAVLPKHNKCLPSLQQQSVQKVIQCQSCKRPMLLKQVSQRESAKHKNKVDGYRVLLVSSMKL